MIDTVASLIDYSYAGNQLGRITVTEVPTDIYCRVGSVNRAEYYAAYDSGFRPEFRVTTDPVNYDGQSVIDLTVPEGVVRCDIYRTYRKSLDTLELWCVRRNPEAEQVYTLWTDGKIVHLYGAYLSGSRGELHTQIGHTATDEVTLILPPALRAFVGTAQVGYARPKEYAAMSGTVKAAHFCIGPGAFFALGELTMDGKYQAVNAAYDDVYLVQSVARKTSGKPDTEYLEVTGK